MPLRHLLRKTKSLRACGCSFGAFGNSGYEAFHTQHLRSFWKRPPSVVVPNLASLSPLRPPDGGLRMVVRGATMLLMLGMESCRYFSMRFLAFFGFSKGFVSQRDFKWLFSGKSQHRSCLGCLQSSPHPRAASQSQRRGAHGKHQLWRRFSGGNTMSWRLWGWARSPGSCGIGSSLCPLP